MPLKKDRNANPLLDRKLAIHVLKSLEADVMIATIHVGRQENSVCNTEYWGDLTGRFSHGNDVVADWLGFDRDQRGCEEV